MLLASTLVRVGSTVSVATLLHSVVELARCSRHSGSVNCRVVPLNRETTRLRMTRKNAPTEILRPQT